MVSAVSPPAHWRIAPGYMGKGKMLSEEKARVLKTGVLCQIACVGYSTANASERLGPRPPFNSLPVAPLCGCRVIYYLSFLGRLLCLSHHVSLHVVKIPDETIESEPCLGGFERLVLLILSPRRVFSENCYWFYNDESPRARWNCDSIAINSRQKKPRREESVVDFSALDEI